MGIRGLSGYLKWKAPEARRALSWTLHTGQRWAIDASCLLYRARSANLSPITVIASLLVRMKDMSIVPIFVFDGKPPVTKAEVIEQRKEHRETTQREIMALEYILDTSANMSQIDKAMTEKRMADLKAQIPQVTSGDKDQIKQLLYGAGILFLNASGEADDLIGFLARTNMVQAVLSTDMDMLARGVDILITPDTPDAGVLTVIDTNRVLQALRLSYSQFVDACVLMGTDYTSLPTMRPQDAVEKARRGPIGLAEYDVAIAILKGEGVTLESVLSEQQFAKWVEGAPNVEANTVRQLATSYGWPPNWVTSLSYPT